MFGTVQKQEWPANKEVYQVVRGNPYPEDAWQRRFYDLGYCNCGCHNHAEKDHSHHSWGECQCYHPDKLYHDDGVLTANPIRLLPFDHYDDGLRHNGGATAGVMSILQASIRQPTPPKSWYIRAWDFLTGWF